jgi:hypothetical protein
MNPGLGPIPSVAECGYGNIAAGYRQALNVLLGLLSLTPNPDQGGHSDK